MRRKQFAVKVLGLILCLMISLNFSMVYSAGLTEAMPPGSILPQFKLQGPDSPETKAYLGLKDNKPFSLSQAKTKLVLVEFIDVF